MDVPAAAMGPTLDRASMTRLALIMFIWSAYAASIRLALHGIETLNSLLPSTVAGP